MKKTLLFLILFLQSLITFAQNPTDVLQTFGYHPGFNSTINATAIQSDGKIIVGGNFGSFQGIIDTYFVRLNADGSKDTSFTGNLLVNNIVNAIVLQPDGKIIVGHDRGLIRLNTDGSKDTSFNLGTGFSALESYGYINSIALQPDGKIIVVGAFNKYQGITQQHILRLNPDGSKDTTFNIGTGFTGSVMPYLYSVVLQPDGKIIVAGIYQNYQDLYQGSMVRLNIDGSIDTTFKSIFSSLDKIKSLAIQTDGKILVATYNSTPNRGLLRLNPDGSKDTSFSIGSNGFNAEVNFVSIQPDGKILAGGKFTYYESGTQRNLIRLNIDGSKDSSFNTGTGFIKFDTSITSTAVNHISLLPNGKILASGDFNLYQDTTKNNIVRVNDDGSIDKSFDTGTGLDDGVLSIISQSDRKIIAAGAFTSYDGIPQNRLIRFGSDGKKDLSFNIGKGFDNTINCIYAQPDGKIIVGGYFKKYQDSDYEYLTRINPDGTIDPSFLGYGIASSSKIYFELYVKAIAVQQDGKIIVGGNFGKYQNFSQEYLVRLNPDGSRDGSFNIGTGFNSTVHSIAIQSDGKIIVGGKFTSYQGVTQNGLIRLNPDGSKDTTFNIGTGMGYVNSIVIQPNGKIIVGGNYSYYNGIYQRCLVRLNPDGSKDTSFDIGTGFNENVNSIYLQTDGKILVGGNFTAFQDINQNRLIRLNNDGSKDTTFDIGTGFNKSQFDTDPKLNSVNSIAVQPDGVVAVGGLFVNYKNIRSSYLVNINGSYIASPLIAANSQINVSCAGGSTGSASVSVTGGKRPYSYLWSNGATTSTITKLAAGNYSCDITDADLTKTTQNFTITNDVDTEIPTITAPPSVTVNAVSGCEATNVVLGTPVTNDNCSVISVTNDAPLSFPVGLTRITWTVKDASNNIAQATQMVTVKDITKPEIIAPPTLTVEIESCGTSITNLGNPLITDCSFVTIKNNNPSFFPLGETTITWTARDSDNNTATATQLVIVKNINAYITYNAGILSVPEGNSYRWFECNNGILTQIPNESKSSYTPNKAGSYAVKVTKNSCTATSTCYEIKTLGTKDFDLENSLKLYPNPTKDFITIEMKALDNAKLKIFDINGQFILSKELKTAINTINISHLASGVYIFEISNDNGKTIKKVIKK